MYNNSSIAYETEFPAGPGDIFRRPKDDKEYVPPPPRPEPVKTATDFLQNYIKDDEDPEIAGMFQRDTYPQGVQTDADALFRRGMDTTPTGQRIRDLRDRIKTNPGSVFGPQVNQDGAAFGDNQIAGLPFGISEDEMYRRKALRDIIDTPGYDPNSVRQAQKQWIELMQSSPAPRIRGV